MTIEFRPITEAEFPALLLADERGFGGPPHKTDAPDSWARGELHRAFGAFDGTTAVAVGRNYTFELTVPGGAMVPAAAVSWISTSPTHRRKGLLTKMMHTLHRDARDRGEVVSMLTASEGAIYRRFGYGIAASRVGMSIESARAAFVHDVGATGSVRFVSFEEAADLFPPVYEVARRARAGMVSRPDYWWPEVLFGQVVDGADAKFAIVHEDPSGSIDGYALYTMSGSWSNGIANRTVEVVDIQATTAAGRAAVWRYLLSIDLVVRVSAWNVPLDEPLRWLLTDPRRLRVDFVNDGLYVHLLDDAVALSARTYEATDEIVLAVTHTDGTEHSLLLDTSSEVARCATTKRRPDLAMPASSLGAIYLGGVAPTNLAAAGWITECKPGALARADRMFVTSIAPAMLSYF